MRVANDNWSAVLLDFDGTLIRGNSFKIFCRMVSPSLASFLWQYYLKSRLLSFYSSVPSKHYIGDYFYKNYFKSSMREELNSLLDSMIFEDTKKLISQYKELNYKVIIVSASFSEIIGDYVKNYLDCLLIANNFSCPDRDVNFEGKLIAFREIYPNSPIEVVIGDSAGDYSLMRESKLAYLRTPDGKLTRWP